MAKEIKGPGRVTRDDLAQCTYSPLGETTSPVDRSTNYFDETEDREVTVYCLFGKHHALEDELPVLYDIEYEDGQLEVAEESEDACAKMVRDGTRVTYFVKAGHGGHFYNPIGLYEGGHSRRQSLGRPEWQFVRVHKAAFDLYVRFLKTKHARYLVNAEREVR